MRPVLCPVLVGRDEEIRCLRAGLAGAQAGHGSTVLLAGEAGIGKSRLACEVAALARSTDLIVLAGRAVAGGVPAPYRPFAEALMSAVRPGGLPKASELDPFRPARGLMVPEWRERSDATDAPGGSGGPGASGSPRASGAESLVFVGEAVLRVISPGHGCVLVLEDLHWADRETLALLEYVADNISAEHVLCVGTLRADEGGEARAPAASLIVEPAAADDLSGNLNPVGRIYYAFSTLWCRTRWPSGQPLSSATKPVRSGSVTS